MDDGRFHGQAGLAGTAFAATDAALDAAVAVAVLDHAGKVVAANANWIALASTPLAPGACWPASAIGSDFVQGWRDLAARQAGAAGELLAVLALANEGVVARCECELYFPALTRPRQLHATVSALAGSPGQLALTLSDRGAARQVQTW